MTLYRTGRAVASIVLMTTAFVVPAPPALAAPDACTDVGGPSPWHAAASCSIDCSGIGWAGASIIAGIMGGVVGVYAENSCSSMANCVGRVTCSGMGLGIGADGGSCEGHGWGASVLDPAVMVALFCWWAGGTVPSIDAALQVGQWKGTLRKCDECVSHDIDAPTFDPTSVEVGDEVCIPVAVVDQEPPGGAVRHCGSITHNSVNAFVGAASYLPLEIVCIAGSCEARTAW